MASSGAHEVEYVEVVSEMKEEEKDLEETPPVASNSPKNPLHSDAQRTTKVSEKNEHDSELIIIIPEHIEQSDRSMAVNHSQVEVEVAPENDVSQHTSHHLNNRLDESVYISVHSDVAVQDLVPFCGCLCFVVSCFPQFPECVGCAGKKICLCVEGEFAYCKLVPDPDIWCLWSKTDVICKQPGGVCCLVSVCGAALCCCCCWWWCLVFCCCRYYYYYYYYCLCCCTCVT